MIASVTGILLAGGEGRRLGGLDKGLQVFAGKPMVESMLEVLNGICSTVLISANRNQEIYRRYGYPVIADDQAGFAGPLAGLLATLPLVDDEFTVLVPCDMPCLGKTVLPELLQFLNQSDVDLVIAADGQRNHYSVAACRTQPALLALRRTWAEGQRSLRAWQKLLRQDVLRFDDASLFVNCNTVDYLDSP